jgi:uncharacterized protein (DUF885 family)
VRVFARDRAPLEVVWSLQNGAGVRSRILVLALVFAAIAALAHPAAGGSRQSLDRLADELYWAVQARRLRPTLSDRGNATWLARLDGFQRRLARIETSRLGAEARTTRTLLASALDAERRYLTDGWILEDLNAMDSPLLTIHDAVNATERRTVADWEWVIASLDQSPRFARAYTDLLRRGLAARRVQPAVVVRSSIELAAMLGSASARRNPLLALEPELTRALAGHARLPELRRRLRAALRDHALPAHRGLARFLRREYLPHAPPHHSAASYARAVERHLGPGHDPARLARQGRRAIDRLYKEIERTARTIDPDMTSLDHFMAGLSRRQSERFASGQELLDVTRSEVAIAESLARDLLPIPPSSVTVEPMGKTDERTEDAQYIATGPTSGTFQINSTKKLNGILRHELPAIVTHETFGGHHVQSLHAQKANLPDLRRNASLTVYDEGWAMYADHLRLETKNYSPLEKIGSLRMALWAAALLVVDVGLNTGTMTKTDATTLIARCMFTSRTRASAEIERIMNLPGHGLAYYTGRTLLLRLRATTRHRLGPRFDQRRFNHTLLSGGALPSSLLARRVSRWATRRGKARKPPSRTARPAR